MKRFMLILAAAVVVRQAQAEVQHLRASDQICKDNVCGSIGKKDSTIRGTVKREAPGACFEVQDIVNFGTNASNLWCIGKAEDAHDQSVKGYFPMAELGLRNTAACEAHVSKWGRENNLHNIRIRYAVRHDLGQDAVLAIPVKPYTPPVATCPTDKPLFDTTTQQCVARSVPAQVAPVAPFTPKCPTDKPLFDTRTGQCVAEPAKMAQAPVAPATPPASDTTAEVQKLQDELQQVKVLLNAVRGQRQKAMDEADRLRKERAAIETEIKPLAPAMVAKMDPDALSRHVDKLQRANAKLNGEATTARAEAATQKQRAAALEKIQRKYDALNAEVLGLRANNAHLTASEKKQARRALIAMLLTIALAGGLLYGAFSLRISRRTVRDAQALVADGQHLVAALTKLGQQGGHSAGVTQENRFAPTFELVRRVWTEATQTANAWRDECRALLVEVSNVMSLTFGGSMETPEAARARREQIIRKLREHQEMLVLAPDERTDAVTAEQFTEAARLRAENERLRRDLAEAAPLRLLPRHELEALCREAAEDLVHVRSLEGLAVQDPAVYRRVVQGITERLYARLTRITRQVPAVA